MSKFVNLRTLATYYDTLPEAAIAFGNAMMLRGKDFDELIDTMSSDCTRGVVFMNNNDGWYIQFTNKHRFIRFFSE